MRTRLDVYMKAERGTINILLLQLTQSKAIVLFLMMLLISYFGRIHSSWAWIFEYLFYGSVYFIIYLFTIALTNAMLERRHIVKLKELGYDVINFKVHRIGDVSFWIENINQMSVGEMYQNAAFPFLSLKSYVTELVSLLILIWVNLISPFPLGLVLFAFTLVTFVNLVGSFCALSVIRSRKISGICVKLARTITSRGDIDEIVSWNGNQ